MVFDINCTRRYDTKPDRDAVPSAEPAGTKLAPIAPSTSQAVLTLHRHADGFIALAKGYEDSFRPTTAIRAERFQIMFPEMQVEYLKDGYVSLNAGLTTSKGKDVDSGVVNHRKETLTGGFVTKPAAHKMRAKACRCGIRSTRLS
jgi:hypothetical protein